MDRIEMPSNNTHQAQPSAPTTPFGAPAIGVDIAAVCMPPAPCEGPLATFAPLVASPYGPTFELMQQLDDWACADNTEQPSVVMLTATDPATGKSATYQYAADTTTAIAAALWEALPAKAGGEPW